DKDHATISRDTASAMPRLSATPSEQRDLIAFLSTLNGENATTAASETRAAVVSTVTVDDFDQILRPKAGEWPTYHGRLDGNRHSALNQITTANAANLSLQWVHTLRA